MPGDIAIGFTAARRKNPADDEAYGGRIARNVAVMEHDEENGIPAEKAGAFIAEKALQKKLPVVCTIGGKYKVFVFLTRLIPTKLMADLVGKIYAS